MILTELNAVAQTLDIGLKFLSSCLFKTPQPHMFMYSNNLSFKFIYKLVNLKP